MTIYQVLPSISRHDAISQHVLCIDDELKRRNIDSVIVAEHVDPSLADRATAASALESFDGPILYHLSISSPLAQRVLDSNQEIDLWYHNITPPELFEKWEPFVALELRIAQMQRAQLSLRARRGVAASEFSRVDIVRDGCRHTSIMPVLFDPKSKIDDTDDALDRELAHQAGPKILSVGRIAPHKRIEKLIASFIHYRSNFASDATLHLVGSSASKWYMESLTQYVECAGETQNIFFHGTLSDAQLASYYSAADLYLCTSAHEGFCVPLLEAMKAGLVIVASNAGAIAETLKGGGLVLDVDASPVEYACAVTMLLSEESRRDGLIAQAKQRIDEIDLEKEAQRSVDWLLGADVLC